MDWTGAAGVEVREKRSTSTEKKKLKEKGWAELRVMGSGHRECDPLTAVPTCFLASKHPFRLRPFSDLNQQLFSPEAVI